MNEIRGKCIPDQQLSRIKNWLDDEKKVLQTKSVFYYKNK